MPYRGRSSLLLLRRSSHCSPCPTLRGQMGPMPGYTLNRESYNPQRGMGGAELQPVGAALDAAARSGARVDPVSIPFGSGTPAMP